MATTTEIISATQKLVKSANPIKPGKPDQRRSNLPHFRHFERDTEQLKNMRLHEENGTLLKDIANATPDEVLLEVGSAPAGKPAEKDTLKEFVGSIGESSPYSILKNLMIATNKSLHMFNNYKNYFIPKNLDKSRVKGVLTDLISITHNIGRELFTNFFQSDAPANQRENYTKIIMAMAAELQPLNTAVSSKTPELGLDRPIVQHIAKPI